MKLYDYFRSSAAYRVRIAINLKGLEVDREYVHLTRNGGENLQPAYSAVNPQNLLPALEVGKGAVLTQSLAILEYLEEAYPHPSLLPSNRLERAKVRAVCLAIACDIHPINNLRVLKYLKRICGLGQPVVDAWYRHWIVQGFNGIEKLVGDSGYCFGRKPTLADVCLIPQVFNARRFDVNLRSYPRISRIEEVCGATEAFASAHPKVQADAE